MPRGQSLTCQTSSLRNESVEQFWNLVNEVAGDTDADSETETEWESRDVIDEAVKLYEIYVRKHY